MSDPRPLRLGMVGGGRGAFIGAVHRIAARLDGAFTLVAGALSSDPERARASGRDLGLAEDRIYDDFEAMAQAEAARADGIEAVAIVTPNHLHAAPARAFLARGIHVICDKPLCTSVEEARGLVEAARASEALFVLTHNYSGYPLVRQARQMIREGRLGRLRLVQVEYAQDWLAAESHSKQADWRTDPARTGGAGALGDIGTHAYHLARFVTGLETEALAAELTAFVPGRRVDDDVRVLLRFRGGARGALWASQVAVGCENGLRLRVFGEEGGLAWAQEEPNVLWHTPRGAPTQRLTRGGPGALDAAAAATRLPAGHPEGYLEAFATLYAEAAQAIRAHRVGGGGGESLLPDIADGLEGMAFIDACLRSSRADAAFVELAP